MATLVQRLSNQQIDEAKAKEQGPPKEKEEDRFITSLAAHVTTKWDRAWQAKQPHLQKMKRNKRRRQGRYSTKRLQAIRALYGAEYQPVWANITETKCRAAEAWLKDTILQPGDAPWDLEPTPSPELPPLVNEMVQQQTMDKMLKAAAEAAVMAGQKPDVMSLVNHMEAMAPMIEDMIKKEIKKHAKRAAEEIKEKIEDKFREGHWYEALEECIYDLVTYGTAILKGPILRKETIRYRAFDQSSGGFTPTVEERIVPVFERVDPNMFYAGPDNSGIDDGYCFHKIPFTRSDLYGLIGIEGYDEDAIRRVLDQHRDGGLEEWTSRDSEKKDLDGKSAGIYPTEKIDCLEFWGSVPGSLLKEFGIDDVDITDEQKEYEVAIWLIGAEVIRAILNPSATGYYPFSKASFARDPDSFHGRGVPELVSHAQDVANVTSRSIVNNVAIASGPQVELNIDRRAPGASKNIWPWKVWETTTKGMNEAKAVNFYAPPMVTDKLMAIYRLCIEIADEDSGIPRYAHGEGGAGGAGETASGLSMLITSSARGIKAIVKNIDKGLIEPSVQKMYDYLMDYEEDEFDTLGDIKIVAKGSTSMIAKEQQAVRRNEFLINTNNPTDLQILGLTGRSELLKMAADSMELDVDKIFSEEAATAMQPLLPQGAAPPPAAENTNEAGDAAQGKDFQLEERGE